MGTQAPLMWAGALAVGGLVHLLDASDPSTTCERERRADNAPAQDAVVDFLFAPASVWRHISQEQQLDSMQVAREGRRATSE